MRVRTAKKIYTLVKAIKAPVHIVTSMVAMGELSITASRSEVG